MLSPVCLINLLLLVLLPLTKPVAVHCCSFQSMITCCYHFVFFQIPIRIFLSILSFHDPSLKLSHRSVSFCDPPSAFTQTDTFSSSLCPHLSPIAMHTHFFRIPHIPHRHLSHTIIRLFDASEY